jgi:uncharacterized protein (TIGR02466 family)
VTLDWVQAPLDAIPEEKAAAVLRQAVAQRPDDIVLRLRLARVLHARDSQQEIIDLLAPAVAAVNAPEEAFFIYGRAAGRLDDPETAIAALRRAGDASEVAGYLADALLDAGRKDEALACALATLARVPDERRSLTVVSKVLLARGDTRALLDLCRDLRTRGGRNAEILAMLALSAWAEDAPECAKLLDRVRWFEKAVENVVSDTLLAEEILAHPALGRSPGYKATRGDGVRIEQLDRYGGPRAQELLSVIRDRVGRYAAARGVDLPPKVSLAAWALVLRGSGHEEWHIHPAARISGVYYVAVPPVSGAAHAGQIGFGPLRAIAGRDMGGFPSWNLRPRGGELLLFPSYFAHRTWPTHADAPRVCVAFDVVPVASG